MVLTQNPRYKLVSFLKFKEDPLTGKLLCEQQEYKHFFFWSENLWRKLLKYRKFQEFQDFRFRFSEKYFHVDFFCHLKIDSPEWVSDPRYRGCYLTSRNCSCILPAVSASGGNPRSGYPSDWDMTILTKTSKFSRISEIYTWDFHRWRPTWHTAGKMHEQFREVSQQPRYLGSLTSSDESI